MAIDTSVKLQLPEHAYGAVYGRDRAGQVKRYKIFTVLVTLWLAVSILAIFFKTFFPSFEGYWAETLHGITIFFAITGGIIGWFIGVFVSLLTYSAGVYNSDIYHGRRDYAKTVFKDWFEKRYDTKISKDDAIRLMNGDFVSIPRTVTVDGKSEVEYVRARFDYSYEFTKFCEPGKRISGDFDYTPDNWVAPVVTDDTFNLLVLEEPAKPRVYAWS